MPVIAVADSLIEEASAVRLARYAQIVGYTEDPFWGVNHNLSGRSCREIWTLKQRQMVAKYLAEAQDEIENEIGYPVGPRWFSELKAPYTLPSLAKVGYVLEGGVKATSTMSAGAAVSHVTDPAVIGPLATTVTDPAEIVVYHPGTTIEIDPSSVVIAGGNVTIQIPRCRMVKAAYVNNPDVGLDYATLANFESTVDVVRVYNDPATQATLSTNHRCNAACSENGCTAYTTAACLFVTGPEVGAVEVRKGTYTDGAWLTTGGAVCGPHYRWVQLNYRAGVTLTRQLEDMIIRLAHAKMPAEPCGCDPLKSLWARDRNVPEVLTRERLNCPFGLSDGAYVTWKFAQTIRLVRSGIVA